MIRQKAKREKARSGRENWVAGSGDCERRRKVYVGVLIRRSRSDWVRLMKTILKIVKRKRLLIFDRTISQR